MLYLELELDKVKTMVAESKESIRVQKEESLEEQRVSHEIMTKYNEESYRNEFKNLLRKHETNVLKLDLAEKAKMNVENELHLNKQMLQNKIEDLVEVTKKEVKKETYLRK